MNIAVIGLGGIGRRHVANFTALGCEMRAWDIDLNAWSNIACVVPTIGRALDGADGVVIATPPDSHIALAEAWLLPRPSVAVMIEKPLAPNGAAYLNSPVNYCGRRILVAYPWRHWPPLQYVKCLLDKGCIGRILSARTEYGYHINRHGPHANRSDSYMRSLTRGGGCLLDTSHAIDYLRWLLGEIAEVSAAVVETRTLKMDADDSADVTVRFASGVIGSLHLSLYLPEVTSRLEIVGEDGVIWWDRREEEAGFRLGRTGREETRRDTTDLNEMYLAEATHFLAVIRGEAQPVCDGWDGLRTLQIVDAARRSSAEKRWVTV